MASYNHRKQARYGLIECDNIMNIYKYEVFKVTSYLNSVLYCRIHNIKNKIEVI